MNPILEGIDPERVGERVLVTGGAGFVGRTLSTTLAELGCSVRTFDLRPGPGDAIVGDITDPDMVARACEGIDTVFHTAATLALWGFAWRSERDRVSAVNVGGTRNVVDGCKAHEVRRLVHVSTTNVVLEPRTGLDGVDESSPYATRFVDLYTPSKIEGERLVLAAHSDSLRTIALRPNGIWGPGGDSYMIRAFLRQIAGGNLWMTAGKRSALIDNTHVDNLVRGAVLAAEALTERPEIVGGKPYFITDGEAINAVEWFRPLAEALGVKFPDRNLPAWLLRPISAVVELSHLLTGGDPVLTRAKATKLCVSNWSSIEAARRDLGYEPLRTQKDLLTHADSYREVLDGMRRR